MQRIIIALVLMVLPVIAEAGVAGQANYISGDVWVMRDSIKTRLGLNDQVMSGDVVLTDLSGRAKLVMQDKSVIYVGRKSRITIDRYETKNGNLLSGSFNMLWGKVRFLVTKLNNRSSEFSVRTKTATIGVRGTEFAVLVEPPRAGVPFKPDIKLPDMPDTPTTVMLFSGAVVGKPTISIRPGRVTPPTLIKPGKMARFGTDGSVKMRPIKKPDIKKLDIDPLRPQLGGGAKGKPEFKPGVKRPVAPVKPGGKVLRGGVHKEGPKPGSYIVKDPVLMTKEPVFTKDPVLTKDPILTTDPVLTRDPILSDPLVKDPILSDPIVRDPILSDPIITDPLIKEPIITEPLIKEPIITEPLIKEPILTYPILTKPRI